MTLTSGRGRILSVVICASLLLAGTAVRAETIRLTTGASPVDQPYGRYLSKVFSVAFAQLGYDFELLDVQSKRASQLVNLGYYDGEATRVLGYGKRFPKMIRIDVPHSDLIFSAYSTDPQLTMSSWSDLKDFPHVVAYRRGAVRPKNLLTKLLPAEKVQETMTTNAGLNKAAAGEVHVYVGLQTKVRAELSKMSEQKAKLHEVGDLERIPCYVYLHEKHAELAARFEAILKKMKESGEIATYYTNIYEDAVGVK